MYKSVNFYACRSSDIYAVGVNDCVSRQSEKQARYSPIYIRYCRSRNKRIICVGINQYLWGILTGDTANSYMYKDSDTNGKTTTRNV